MLGQNHEQEQNKLKIQCRLFTSFLRFKAPIIPISCLVGSSLIVKCEHSKEPGNNKLNYTDQKQTKNEIKQVGPPGFWNHKN